MRVGSEFFMKLAIEEAWRFQGLTYPNPAVGAVVTREGKILCVEAHRRAGEAHAEVRALLAAYESIVDARIPDIIYRDAFKAHEFLLELPEGFFSECEIYVTLEPCSHMGKTPSCASLLASLSPKRVYMACGDPIEGHGGGAALLREKGIDVLTGVCKEEASILIEPFLIWRERGFVLFKLAQTSNGRIGGGYLSSKESLEHVHSLRAVADRLVIGGNTVRSDRPRLDCRFVKEGRAPDITIYSRRNDFDETIPLFEIPDREVEISDTLHEVLQKPGFLLVEGGEGMLRALAEKIDWMLFYQTPKLSVHPLSYNIDKNLQFLHHSRVGVDIVIWSRFG